MAALVAASIFNYEAGFGAKINQLLDIIRENPFAPYPLYEKLIGDLTGAY
ncbi:hypothetical protein [Sporomusa sp. GT1]|nr:hypothetical protein [Sporomusa sp. GT1]